MYILSWPLVFFRIRFNLIWKLQNGIKCLFLAFIKCKILISFPYCILLQSHTILLVQFGTNPDTRTYSDYNSVKECMNGKKNALALVNNHLMFYYFRGLCDLWITSEEIKATLFVSFIWHNWAVWISRPNNRSFMSCVFQLYYITLQGKARIFIFINYILCLGINQIQWFIFLSTKNG